MKILITGATGVIGTEIVKQCLEQNIAVNYLTTQKEKIRNEELYKGFLWNPLKGSIDINCFQGVDAVINLAGASIAQRWTPKNKRNIIKSRVQSLQTLKMGLEHYPNHKIKTIITASAIGIYPHSHTIIYNEETKEVDASFLGEVVTAWEVAANQLKSLKIPICKIRVGLVLSKKGGALPQLITPVKYYLGTIFGDGSQWQSWVHVQDIAALFLYAAKHKLAGIYNGVAPNPVKHREFMKNLTTLLKKPLWLPKIKSFVLKILLGEMAYMLLVSQQVSSEKTEIAGFVFKYRTLRKALKQLLE